MERRDSGCRRAWGSLTSTGAPNGSRATFDTMNRSEQPQRQQRGLDLPRSVRAALGGHGQWWGEYPRSPATTVPATIPIVGREPDSLSPGKVSAIHEDSDGVLWVGFFPRALDRLDRKTGPNHPLCSRRERQSLSKGNEVNSILKDARGYLWVGGRARVWIGSMNAAASSSITRTILLIPTA